MLLLCVKFMVTVVVFWLGYKTSQVQKSHIPTRCSSQSTGLTEGQLRSRSTPPAASVGATAGPCENEKTSLSLALGTSTTHTGTTMKSKEEIPTICSADGETAKALKVPRTYLHAWKGDAAAELFPQLHNPASPAKWSFVMNSNEDWTADGKWKRDLNKPTTKGQLMAPDAEQSADPFLSKNCDEIYLTRTGSRQSQPNKCVAVARVAKGQQSPVQSSHRIGFTARLTNQYQGDYSRDFSQKEEQDLLPPMLQQLDSLKELLLSKLGNPIEEKSGQRRTATVMVANEGVMDLVLNWACSSEAAGVNLKDTVIFVGTEETAVAVENIGANAIYSPALGSMPRNAAGGYLDDTFSRMMWFKTTSVYLAMTAGFNVLFQDADLVWLKSPLDYLGLLEADAAFMDDGARTPRYTPFFVNSGFYYLKYNPRTLHFQEMLLKSGPSEIGYTHSHQSVLIRHLSETHHLYGLKVQLLDKDLFPSGQAYHERKQYIQKIIDRTYEPFVFHMCWTSNRDDKLKYFREIGLWYLPDDPRSCSAARSLVSWAQDQKRAAYKGHESKNLRDNCCVRKQYFKLKE